MYRPITTIADSYVQINYSLSLLNLNTILHKLTKEKENQQILKGVLFAF